MIIVEHVDSFNCLTLYNKTNIIHPPEVLTTAKLLIKAIKQKIINSYYTNNT